MGLEVGDDPEFSKENVSTSKIRTYYSWFKFTIFNIVGTAVDSGCTTAISLQSSNGKPTFYLSGQIWRIPTGTPIKLCLRNFIKIDIPTDVVAYLLGKMQ